MDFLFLKKIALNFLFLLIIQNCFINPKTISSNKKRFIDEWVLKYNGDVKQAHDELHGLELIGKVQVKFSELYSIVSNILSLIGR
jgi:hypothetical protein